MYELHNLGWTGFQRLCLTIVREVFGQTVESFLDTNDAGRDGAFAGTWQTTGGESFTGRFVIQCKFTSRPNYVLRLTDLKEELVKARRLVAQGRCDGYILLTNAGVSGRKAAQVEDLFRDVGVKHVITHGLTWISEQIRERKRLRMLVPRLYGLGDLSQILDARAYRQARALLASLREELAKIVITDAYRKAAAALDRDGFVLLIGEPAVGKTTVASLLAVAAIDQWKASLLKLDTPGKVIDHWNPDEPSQFFWIDDAFGVAQYEDSLARGWNHILPQLPAMLRSGAKVVMTSRDYIYRSARRDLKEGAFPLLRESHVVIDVEDLKADEKRQILYNHLKLGKQSVAFRTEVKPYLEAVAMHPRFIPETARRLGDPVFTKGLYIFEYSLKEFVDKREQLLQEVLQGLDDDSKGALALIYMRNDRLESPVVLQPTEEHALARLRSDIGGSLAALKALDGSLVQLINDDDQSFWRFKHPTIGDAYATLLVSSPDLLSIYLQGTEPEKFVEQITCGDVGIERAVLIPKSLYPLVLDRLDEFETTAYKDPGLARWAHRSGLQGFLARRCSKEFVSLYIARHPELLGKVSTPGLFLSAVPETTLAVRLYELGVLPEEHRRKFVDTVSGYALDGSDMYALESLAVRSVFHHDEFVTLLEKVRREVVPRLGDIRRNWQSNYPSDDMPESHMQPLLDSLKALKNQFPDADDEIRQIDEQTELIDEWIREHTKEENDQPRATLGEVGSPEQLHGERSIFEDVDS